MNWSGMVIPFNMTDILNGVAQTFSSFSGLVWLVVGLGIAFYCLEGILALFRGESFFHWNR